MLGVDFIIGIILWLIILKIIIYITAPSIYKGPESLVGKVVLITGGNRGIGFEVSKELARRGCKLIIACRSDAERARQEIINFSNNENVIVKRVDLKSFKSVRQFASEIHQSEKKVDVLINNAGVGFDTILSEDGLNPVLQANIYSAFLLTHLLIDLLKQSDDGRIIFTSSSFAFANNLTIDNLDAHFPGDDQTVHYSILNYGNSKLAQLISSKIFAKKLWEYGIKSNAIHPGIIYTDIFQAMEGKFGIGGKIFGCFFYFAMLYASRTCVEGAQGIIELATSQKHKNTTGQFFWGFKMYSFYPNPWCLRNKKFCNEIWSKLESVVGLAPEEKL